MSDRWAFATAMALAHRKEVRSRAKRELEARARGLRKSGAQWQGMADYDRDTRKWHAEARLEEVAGMNEDLEKRVSALTGLLTHTLAVDDRLEFDALKLRPSPPAWTRSDLEQPKP